MKLFKEYKGVKYTDATKVITSVSPNGLMTAL